MWWAALDAVAELAAPRCCAVCGDPGVSLCAGCLRALALLLVQPATPVRPDPPPPGFPDTWALTAYDGAVAAAIKAHKDHGRHDLTPVLAELLRHTVASVLAQRPPPGPVHVVPVPSSAASVRARGRRPLREITRAALRDDAIPVHDALRSTGRVRDQVGLSAAQRAANQHGAMRGDRRRRPGLVVVVDDIVTSGATLCEAHRALRSVGAADVLAVTLAATPRRRTTSPAGAP